MKKNNQKILAVFLAMATLTTLCSCAIGGENGDDNGNGGNEAFKLVKDGEALAFFDGVENNIYFIADDSNEINGDRIGMESCGVDGKAEIEIAFEEGFSHKVGKYELKNIEGEYSYELAIYDKDIEIGYIRYYIQVAPETAESYTRGGDTYYLVSQGDKYTLEARVIIDIDDSEDYENLVGDFSKDMVVPELPKFLQDDKMFSSDNVKGLVAQAEKYVTEESPLDIVEYYYEEYKWAMIIAIFRTEDGSYSPLRIIPVLKTDGTLGIYKIQEIWVERDTPEEVVERLEEDLTLYPLDIQ